MRKLRQSTLLVPQCEHYCANGVVVQALTSIQVEDVSEITPMAEFVFKLLFRKTCTGYATLLSGV